MLFRHTSIHIYFILKHLYSMLINNPIYHSRFQLNIWKPYVLLTLSRFWYYTHTELTLNFQHGLSTFFRSYEFLLLVFWFETLDLRIIGQYIFFIDYYIFYRSEYFVIGFSYLYGIVMTKRIVMLMIRKHKH